MKLALAVSAAIVLCAIAGASVASATHGIGNSRPAHLAESTAHTSSGPVTVAQAMVNGYDYWNGAASARPLNTYQYSVPIAAGVKYDLVVDFVPEGGQACVYDFTHCTNVTSLGYATYVRFADLNVGQIVWNSTKYYSVGTPIIDGLNFRWVAARHELGHDQYLDDHATAYDGLMCHQDTCTRRSAANTAELDAASAFFQARPIPANTISASTATANSIVVNFSGVGNADSLVPARATSLTNWVFMSPIATSATSYTFGGLAPNTTYNFRVISQKTGQPDSSSQWVTATTAAPLNRPTNFTINANGSTSVSLTWTAVAGAASYQICYASGPNDAPSSWTCSAASGTSGAGSAPSTSTKTVRYYAVRAVDGAGAVSQFSNRGTVSRINETVGDHAYKSYHTVYKDSGGVKQVNARNKHSASSGPSRWLGYNNGNGADNKVSSVAPNTNWFSPGPSGWNVVDQTGAFGPTVLAFEAVASNLFVQDSIAHSTICMVVESSCN